ncbi:MAG TPA: hypothetical protein VKM93_24445 [Terriglobia bacterium]|nr:hypothetical protein [Terriglobia bacterium]
MVAFNSTAAFATSLGSVLLPPCLCQRAHGGLVVRFVGREKGRQVAMQAPEIVRVLAAILQLAFDLGWSEATPL